MEFNYLEFLNNFQYNSILILSFFFICFCTLILKYITNGASNKLLFSTYRSSLLNPLTYVRFFTHILGHQSWKHFSNNFILILLVGPIIEEKYGTENLLIMILITAFVTGVVHNLISKNRLLGASCINFMLIVLSSFTNLEIGKIPITFILIFLFYIVDEIIDTILQKDDNISHMGHVIGAICGCVFGFYLMHYNSFFS